MLPREYKYDLLIIGSGAAGLSLALKLDATLRIAVLSKSELSEGSTLYAQGGISAVLSGKDSLDSHVQDTLKAGAGLCDPEVVRFVVERGPRSVRWLEEIGVAFTRIGDKQQNDYHLTREGGHSHRRVIHAEDATGRAVETTLESKVRAAGNIDIFEHRIAIDLITAAKFGAKRDRCLGAYVLHKEKQRVDVFAAKATVLATGGGSKVYLYTSNPDVATGDGIAMAWRAGAQVANMEFMQFHPTCLYHPQAKSALISEAVRGEGGKLLLPDGNRFMPHYHPQAELAPRDVVARAIDQEMKRQGLECVYLDISHKSAKFIEHHFPNIAARCRKFGFDMAREPVPVVPAAHYTCGGVVTDLDGLTGIPQLYAIGETAFTGLHGANRMASNSLLECLVFADAAAQHISTSIGEFELPDTLPAWDESRVTDSDEEVVVSHNWDELRRFMWDYVGIVRTDKRLQRAKHRIDLLIAEIDEYYGNFRVSNDLLELRNLATVADLIVRSATARKESRGLHHTLDYPELDAEIKNTVLKPPKRTINTARKLSIA